MGGSKKMGLAVKKIGKARRTLNAWDDASSNGSRQSFKETMSAAGSEKKSNISYAAKLIPQMHPKNELKDLCLPGEYKNHDY
jgi:hypothetical protein